MITKLDRVDNADHSDKVNLQPICAAFGGGIRHVKINQTSARWAGVLLSWRALMTMVAGCAFRDGAVVVADSRATIESHRGRQFDDSLQKILPLGKRLAIGYAGHVAIAGLIIQELRKAILKNPRLEVPRRLAQELPRIARHYFKMHRGSAPQGKDSVGFLVAGVDNAGQTSVWSFRSPTFEARQVAESFDVLGSGDVVKHRLRETFARLLDLESLQKRANQLIMDLEGELAKRTVHTEDTVGGLFQVILVGPQGIQPLSYGFYDVDPQGPGHARSMRMEAGRWIQSDLSGKREIPLRRPAEFLRGFSGEQRVHDIRPPQPGGKIGACHLQYFTTCLEVKREIGSTEFVGEMTAFTAFKYPKAVPVLVAVSFWGPIGKHTVTVQFEADGAVVPINSGAIEIHYPLEPAELDIKGVLPIQHSGLGFLELLVDGERLGRRALHFFEPSGEAPPGATEAEAVGLLQKYAADRHAANHETCRDSALEANNAFLTYFVLCQEYQDHELSHRFSGEMRGIYYRSYPLQLKLFLATQLRLSKGDHALRVDLVDVATREATTIATLTAKTSADCREVPLQGEIIAVIPKPALYFCNLYVEDRLLSCVPIPAETGRGQFSYSLTDDSAKRVAAGELLILAKRSQPQDPK